MDKKKYIQTVTEQIRCKRALPLVTKELEGHIEDQKSDYMKAGMNAEEAEEAAVLEMGDPVEVGMERDCGLSSKSRRILKAILFRRCSHFLNRQKTLF